MSIKKRFTEEQIIQILKGAEACLPLMHLSWKYAISIQRFTLNVKIRWSDVSEDHRLKGLEQENAQLKKLLAGSMLLKKNPIVMGSYLHTIAHFEKRFSQGSNAELIV